MPLSATGFTQTAWVEVPFPVQEKHSGLRLDAFLTQRLHRYSRSQVQKLISQERVFIKGRPAKPAYRLDAGLTVIIRYPRRSEPPGSHCRLEILYQDAHLLAVNKPGGVLSHPTDKIHANTVTSILKKQFPDSKLHLIHRLDRDTSGILLLAKDVNVARELTELFTKHLVRKEYLAIVSGEPPWKHKVMDAPIGRENGYIKVRQAVGQGARAVTEFTTLASSPEASLLHAAPRTGRLHQIRVHLAYLGHPLLGDRLYTGSGEFYLKTIRQEITDSDLLALGAPRQMLHAHRLELEHPSRSGSLKITAPLPEDFLSCLHDAGLSISPS